jgi:hypothetical protein
MTMRWFAIGSHNNDIAIDSCAYDKLNLHRIAGHVVHDRKSNTQARRITL